jgi:hypothetical protein
VPSAARLDVTRNLVTESPTTLPPMLAAFCLFSLLMRVKRKGRASMNGSSPVVKYGITDGEQVGWFAEADTLKKAATLIRNAKEFVIAIENGTPRALTAEENAEFESYRKRRGF